MIIFILNPNLFLNIRTLLLNILTIMKNWIKLTLFYIGQSKKHAIFRAKKWNRNLEKILKKPVYDGNYDEIGRVKDIFGPIDLPFISIKTVPSQEFNQDTYLYIKLS